MRKKKRTTMNTTATVGIDIASASFKAALWLDAQRCINAQFDNHVGGFRKLGIWLKRHGFGRLRVGLESTNTYGEALAEWLHDHGYEVLLLNPERVLRYAQCRGQRNKTDPADARLIAEFVARHDDLTRWFPPTAEQKVLRALTRTRTQLVEQRKQLASQLRTAHPAAQPYLRAAINTVAEQIKLIARQITEHLRRWPQWHEQVRRVMTVKGVGLITAVTLLAELPPITHTTDPRSICAWVGLIPRRHQSGNLELPAHIARKGNVHIRNALFMPALVAKRYNPLLRAFAKRLEQSNKTHRAILGAIAHKMLRIIVGLLRSGTDFDPNWSFVRS